MSVNSKMTALADEIRELSGTTEAIGLDAMKAHVGEANDEVASQVELLVQAVAALKGKAGGGSGGVVAINNQDKTITENGTYTADEGYTGLGVVTVDVASGGSSGGWDGVLASERPISIGALFFASDTSLKSIDINAWTNVGMGADTIQIGDYACFSTDSLETVSISLIASDTVSTEAIQIGYNSFSDSGVRFVDLTANNISISKQAFFSCNRLETIRIGVGTRPSKSINLGESAFSECKKLKNVSLGYVYGIGREAFYGCTALEKIEMLDCSYIATYAFYGCTSLNTLIIRSVGVPNISIDSIFNTGILDKSGNPAGGFLYVKSSAYEDVIANLVEQATVTGIDGTLAEQLCRMVIRKIEDYPEICG